MLPGNLIWHDMKLVVCSQTSVSFTALLIFHVILSMLFSMHWSKEILDVKASALRVNLQNCKKRSSFVDPQQTKASISRQSATRLRSWGRRTRTTHQSYRSSQGSEAQKSGTFGVRKRVYTSSSINSQFCSTSRWRGSGKSWILGLQNHLHFGHCGLCSGLGQCLEVSISCPKEWWRRFSHSLLYYVTHWRATNLPTGISNRLVITQPLTFQSNGYRNLAMYNLVQHPLIY